LSFFVSNQDLPLVLGDLSEELQQRAHMCGEAAARRWYRLEAFRNAWVFSKREFSGGTLRVTATSVLCVFGWIVLQNWASWAGRFVGWVAMDLVRLSIPALLGILAGRFLRGREAALAAAFTIVFSFLNAGTVFYFSLVVQQPVPHRLSFWAMFLFAWLWIAGTFSLGSLATRRRPRVS